MRWKRRNATVTTGARNAVVCRSVGMMPMMSVCMNRGRNSCWVRECRRTSTHLLMILDLGLSLLNDLSLLNLRLRLELLLLLNLLLLDTILPIRKTVCSNRHNNLVVFIFIHRSAILHSTTSATAIGSGTHSHPQRSPLFLTHLFFLSQFQQRDKLFTPLPVFDGRNPSPDAPFVAFGFEGKELCVEGSDLPSGCCALTALSVDESDRGIDDCGF